MIYAVVTHIFLYSEIRRNYEQGTRKEPVSWIKILNSILFEAFCDFLRFFLLPFAIFKYKSISKESGTPILLVHGYMQNQTDWFWFRHKLKQIKGIGPIYSLNLYPPFKSITEFAKMLQHKVEEIQQETHHRNIILIGHSMGGLVCSYFNEYYANSGDITKIITLGSPFKGTRMTALGYGKNVKEMSPGSSLLKDLSEKMQNSKTEYYFIASKVDNLIIPWESASPNLPNQADDNRLILEDHGHLRLLISPKVFNQIVLWISKNSTHSTQRSQHGTQTRITP